MLTAVIAMQNEADTLLSRASLKKEYSLFGKRVYEGSAFGQDFSLILSGVGKTNAAAAAMLAVSCLQADRILNFGLAGGICETAEIASLFRVVRAVQYDFDLSEVNGTAKGTLNEYASPYFELAAGSSAFAAATLATGDKLTGSLADLPILKALGADLRDMEGGALAHVCAFTGTPLFAYKSVSNKIGADSVGQYREFTAKALASLSGNMEKIFEEAGR